MRLYLVNYQRFSCLSFFETFALEEILLRLQRFVARSDSIFLYVFSDDGNY